MASNYPGGLDSFDTIASDKKTSDAVGGRTHRAMHNDLGDAIEAVQGELGTDPAGASATVKARFEVIEANDWVTSARIATGAVTPEKLSTEVGAATLEVGTVTIGPADVTISGNVDDGYTLDFVLPPIRETDGVGIPTLPAATTPTNLATAGQAFDGGSITGWSGSASASGYAEGALILVAP